jgi:hypothetical protein
MAATAAKGQFLAKCGRTGIFLVEDIERRQAHVGDFLLAKKDFVALRCRRRIGARFAG